MRILISTPPFDTTGGVAAYNQALRKRLSTQVDYIVRGTRPEHGSSLMHTLRLLKDYGTFLHMMSRNHYDVVHVNTSLGPKSAVRDAIFIWLAKVVGRQRVLVFFHGWDTAFAHKIQTRGRFLFRQTFGRADSAVVLSNEFSEQLHGCGYERRIYRETTTVDDELLGDFDPEARHRTARTEQLPITILFLARIERAKGIYQVLDAFRMLQQQYDSLELVIAGTGTELDQVKQYVIAQGIPGITFSGFITGEQKVKTFQSVDIYVLPSWREGMPLSVLEAMGFGLPIVTRPVGGLKDFFEDGRMGFLLESLEPASLAALLEQLITQPDLRAHIGAYNYQYAREHFWSSSVAKRLEAIYEEIMTS